MTRRGVALAIIGAAVALYTLVALPRGRAASTTAEEYSRLRSGRRKMYAEANAMEKRIDAMSRAARGAPGSASRSRSLISVRRSVLAALEGAPISGVRLQIGRDSRGQGARLHLSAQGRFLDLARLPSRLVDRGTGLVLERVVFLPREQEAGLELDGAFVGGGM